MCEVPSRPWGMPASSRQEVLRCGPPGAEADAAFCVSRKPRGDADFCCWTSPRLVQRGRSSRPTCSCLAASPWLRRVRHQRPLGKLPELSFCLCSPACGQKRRLDFIPEQSTKVRRTRVASRKKKHSRFPGRRVIRDTTWRSPCDRLLSEFTRHEWGRGKGAGRRGERSPRAQHAWDRGRRSQGHPEPSATRYRQPRQPRRQHMPCEVRVSFRSSQAGTLSV